MITENFIDLLVARISPKFLLEHDRRTRYSLNGLRKASAGYAVLDNFLNERSPMARCHRIVQEWRRRTRHA